MTENLTKLDILNYFEDLINEIDINCEKNYLTDLSSNDIKNQKNQQRTCMIEKVEEIKNLNLQSLKFEPFCFFVPFTNGLKDNYKFKNYKDYIGKLIVFKSKIDNELIIQIKEFMTHISFPYVYDFDSFDEVLMLLISTNLIVNQFTKSIIDLSQVENNILEKIELIDLTERFKRIRSKNITILPTILNLKSVKHLTLNITDLYPFPDYLDYFPNLITLEIFQADIDYLPTNGFSCLNQLETLNIESRTRRIEKDAFRGLISLKRLNLSNHSIKTLDSDMLNGLENVEKLQIYNFRHLSLIKPNTFINQKKLVQLYIDGTNLENISLNGLDSLKHLYLRYNYKKLVFDSRIFTDVTNLTVINLQRCITSQLANDVFKPIKCLKFLNVNSSNPDILFPNSEILLNYDFLKPLKELEYLRVYLTDESVKSFNQVRLDSLKFLHITCEIVPILNNNFNNLNTLCIFPMKRLQNSCFDKLDNIKHLLLRFERSDDIIKIESLKLNELANLNYMAIHCFYNYSDDYMEGKAKYFIQMFGEKKISIKCSTGHLEVTKQDALIDVYSGLSSDTKEAIEISKLDEEYFIY